MADKSYTIETDSKGNELGRIPFIGSAVFGYSGLCRAFVDNPQGDRSIETYDKEVLTPMISDGIISDGSNSPFDDRKMRYDSSEVVRVLENLGGRQMSALRIDLGHSHFQEYREKGSRTREQMIKMRGLGNKYFDDPYAFFPRNPGVTGIIKTLDKKIVIGRRNIEEDSHDDLLQGPAGHLTFVKDLELWSPRPDGEGDMSSYNITHEMYKELREETGVEKEKIQHVEFLGVFSDPSVFGDDLDVTYLLDVNVSSDYFTAGTWKDNVPEKEREHSDFFAINSFDELEVLTNEGKLPNNDKKWDIVFSTLGPLEQLTAKDFE